MSGIYENVSLWLKICILKWWLNLEMVRYLDTVVLINLVVNDKLGTILCKVIDFT